MIAIKSVEHYQETDQCISGCIVVDVDNYRIVVALECLLNPDLIGGLNDYRI